MLRGFPNDIVETLQGEDRDRRGSVDSSDDLTSPNLLAIALLFVSTNYQFIESG